MTARQSYFFFESTVGGSEVLQCLLFVGAVGVGCADCVLEVCFVCVEGLELGLELCRVDYVAVDAAVAGHDDDDDMNVLSMDVGYELIIDCIMMCELQ